MSRVPLCVCVCVCVCGVQVTVRGAMPCCAVKKLARILSRVVRQFDGLGNVQLDRVVCPGCVIAERAAGSRCAETALSLIHI